MSKEFTAFRGREADVQCGSPASPIGGGCLVIRALRGIFSGFLVDRQQLRRPELERQFVDGPGEVERQLVIVIDTGARIAPDIEGRNGIV